ncbi:nucleotidyltransferase family protein [Paenibacillus polymyxa]|uniref:nucleotidyltransferase family protein n=1 Tax=Paenibacillus polymyxa TaxID=1406 RepID=UPI001BE87372|nr:nucleotidyltransferase family protein [Paenibacillus polymyxa]MBT2284114.1 nucleotidyltransferase family protein [Paenibacillus polymyxa]
MVQVKDSISSLLPKVEDEKVLDFIRKHRLENYFCNQKDFSLVEELHEDITQISKLHKDKLDFLNEYNAITGTKPFIIKGFSSYYLTDNVELLRKSNDIDIFVDKPLDCIEHLIEQGFSETKSPNAHEYSTLIRDTIEIDLHQYFPINGYPSEFIKRKDFDKNFITKSSIKLVSIIDYNELIQHAVVLKGCMIPTVTMSAFISCINIFNDYISGFAKIPSIKLIELIDVIELFNHHNFNHDVFKKLVEKHQAHDAISFSDNLIRNLCGISLFKSYEVRAYSYFPQIFYWQFNTWFVPKNMIDILVVDNLDTVFQSFQSTKVQVPFNTYKSYSNKSKERSLLGIEKNKYGETPEIEVSVKFEEYLFISVNVFTNYGINNDIIHLNTGRLRKTVTKATIEHTDKNIFEYLLHDQGYIVEFRIPKENIVDLINQNKLNIILFVEHNSEADTSSNNYFIELVRE